MQSPRRRDGSAFAVAAPLTPLTAVVLGQIGGGFWGGANGAYIVVLAERLAVSPGALWWVASSFGFALLATAATGGWLLRRMGARWLLRAGATLGAVAAIVLSVLPGYSLAVPAALASGLSGSWMLLSSIALFRGSAVAMTMAVGVASTAGLLAAPAIGAVELAGLSGGWALLLPVPALLAVVICGVRETAADSGYASSAPGAPDSGGRPADPAPGPGRGSWRRHLRPASAAWIAIVLVVAAEFCFFIWGVARLVDAGLSTAWAAIAGVAFPLGMVIGRLLGARLLPDPDAALARRRLRLAAVLTALATVGVVTGPVALVFGGLLLAGLALSITYPNALSLLVSVPGLSLRSSAPLSTAASGVAITLAPLCLAALAQTVDLRWAFLLPLPLAAAVLLVTAPSFAVPDERPMATPAGP